MNGRESLSQAFTLLSFVSASLIGLVHVFGGSVLSENKQMAQSHSDSQPKEALTVDTELAAFISPAPAYPKATPLTNISTLQEATIEQPLQPFLSSETVEIQSIQTHNSQENITQDNAYESLDREILTARAGFSMTKPMVSQLLANVQQGDRSRSLSSPTQLVVDLSDRHVILKRDGYPDEAFPIAIGREGWETPIGKFTVISKQEYPVWQNPITNQIVEVGSKNPLGTRWIGFWSDGYNQLGFHGTNQNELIGQAVSHGCIRMRNEHIQWLYHHISIGTPVTIQG